MIKVECANCHNHFFTPPKAAGKSGKCPSCGEMIIVPIPGEELVGPHQDAPPPSKTASISKTNRESASPSHNGNHAGHQSNDRKGTPPPAAKPSEEEKGFKEKTMEWLKEIFELEE
jgi:hypothetical protein